MSDSYAGRVISKLTYLRHRKKARYEGGFVQEGQLGGHSAAAMLVATKAIQLKGGNVCA